MEKKQTLLMTGASKQDYLYNPQQSRQAGEDVPRCYLDVPFLLRSHTATPLPHEKNIHGGSERAVVEARWAHKTSYKSSYFTLRSGAVTLQGGPLPVINGVIAPINGLING